MKTQVLGYSENGVYVQVESDFTIIYVDMNTATEECIEVHFDDILGLQECRYNLSAQEKQRVSDFFNEIIED